MRTVSQDSANILVVEDDDEVARIVTDYIERSMKARVKRVTTATEAVSSSTSDQPEVVLADLDLPDSDDLELARQLKDESDCEVILMTGQPSLDRAIEAMRLGVRDMFPKPFDLRLLGKSLEEALDARRQRHREQHRYDRLRRVSSHIIRERRVLKQRVDLICRDLVGAYRRLAEKVVSRDEPSN